jgi:hypothetical protein
VRALANRRFMSVKDLKHYFPKALGLCSKSFMLRKHLRSGCPNGVFRLAASVENFLWSAKRPHLLSRTLHGLFSERQ